MTKEMSELVATEDELKRLSPKHAEVLNLWQSQAEPTYAEIADTIGLSIGTVKSRISRAREAVLRIRNPPKEIQSQDITTVIERQFNEIFPKDC